MFNPSLKSSSSQNVSGSLLSLAEKDERHKSPRSKKHSNDSDSDNDRQSIKSKQSYRYPEKHEFLDEQFFS